MAKAMGARRTVARVYAPVFRDLSTFDYQRHFKIDRLLSLEHLSAMELARGIRHPGSVVLENLARGSVEVHEVIVSPAASSVIGKQLKDVGLPSGVRVGSISRNGETHIAGADDRIEVGDRLTIIGTRKEVDVLRNDLCHDVGGKMGVVIAGGGETGYHLAQILDVDKFAVVVLEIDRERCDFLAEKLKRATVVHSDATRRAVLEEERVGSADAFVACTGDDEDNIMCAIEAKDIGAKSAMVLVGRPDYAQVVGKLGIDLVVSPRQVMAKQILGFLNSGPVISRISLGDGTISVLEVEVLPDAPATEHVLANLDLPKQCLIAAVMREDFTSVPGGDDRLREGDTVVVLVDDSEVDAALKAFGSEKG
jgi:trk system potassium uptake protein TrkA